MVLSAVQDRRCGARDFSEVDVGNADQEKSVAKNAPAALQSFDVETEKAAQLGRLSCTRWRLAVLHGLSPAFTEITAARFTALLARTHYMGYNTYLSIDVPKTLKTEAKKQQKNLKARRRSTKVPLTDDFESVARRLGADEDKASFEAKLGKIAKAKPKGRIVK